MMSYLQSVSAWNLISSELKPHAEMELKKYCISKILDNNLIERKIKLDVCTSYI